MTESQHPPPRAPLRSIGHREVLEDGTDVTRMTERELLIRVANASLRTDYAVGKLTAEVSVLTLKIDGLSFARVREPSIPQVAQAIVEAVEEITDHGQNRPPEKSDSDRFRVIAGEVVEKARDSDELEAFRHRVRFRWEVAKQAIGAAGGVALVEICRLLFTHHW